MSLITQDGDPFQRALRGRISSELSEALKAIPGILGGWEGGSAAFGALDNYSDLDLFYLVAEGVSIEDLYASAEKVLETVSPIRLKYTAPPGRYYQVEDGGEFFLVDLCFVRVGLEDFLDAERHGEIRVLFDKGHWLRPRSPNQDAVSIRRTNRCRELQTWFPVSQSFVRKAILRGRQVEAVAAFWAYTLKPLVELLRMRYCPVRWDFGMRYLERDLPPAVYDEVRDLTFVKDLEELDIALVRATAWGAALLAELDPSAADHSDA
jgi:hypothetical protein